jgi:hypothetical protein
MDRRTSQALDNWLSRSDDEGYNSGIDDEDIRIMEEVLSEVQGKPSAHDIDRLMDLFEEGF